jgi:Ca2+-binding RTX toxin-like protein
MDVHAAPGASIEAAAAQAGHDTLVNLYPYLQSMFDQALAADLRNIAPGPAQAGTAVGAAVAQEILAARAHDGSQLDAVGQQVNYVYGQQPGEWRPDPLHPDATPLTPDWGQVTPFAVQSATQFGAPPPPSLTSQEYADAYEEVKTQGGDGVHTPTNRTAEQTQIGLFWGYDAQPGLCAPIRLYNQIAETLAIQEGNTEITNARFFALINLAMGDASITCWNDKFRYNFWRPVMAIRENDPGTGPTGQGSGNPYLVGQGDATWQPLGAPADNGGGTNFTPPFPSYTSGHATFGGALFGVMRDFFGTDNIQFTVVSDEFNTITVDQNGIPRPLQPRSFDNFSQAAEENGQSRIYLGIHFSFDKVQGIKSGTEIADYVYANYLKPIAHHQQAPASPTGLVGRTLVVSGTPGNDLIAVTPSGSNLVVFRNGQIVGTYPMTAVQYIIIDGGAGSDLIKIDPTIKIDAAIYGGTGNDVLRGGGGTNRIFGGAGNDILMGGPGNNFMFGGDGNDTLMAGTGNSIMVGGDGNDLLIAFGGNNIMIGGNGSDLLIGAGGHNLEIAGSTIYDNNIFALTALMAEWASGVPLAMCVNHLENGGGKNGPYMLIPGQTMFDDQSPDLLLELAAMSWAMADKKDQVYRL